ncbi:MAG: VWA domain-containing protein, partial [Ktedonobacter sp. 13_2_20CM_2_54_8]
MFERFFKNRYGYSRWDGTQQVEGLDADEILKALSDDYMENGNLQQALKRLMQDGMRSDDGRRTMGLRELMERMREQRNQQLNRYNMASGVMDDLREKLEEIKQLERAGIQRRLDGEQSDQQQAAQQPAKGAQGQEDQQQSPGSQSQQGQEGQQGESGGENGSDLTPEQKRKMLEMIAKRKQDYLDNLPADIPGQVKGLSEYDFMDDQAREKFKELMDSLQQQMMQQFFQGMQQSLQNMTPEDIARMREMIRDLNKMLRERQEGKEPDFDSFMQKHGEYFPGVNSLDDLIEQMQQQMAAMQGIMDNLSSEQQEELQNLMEQLMGDDRIRVDLMELAQNLEAVAPMENMRTRFNFRGDESLPLNEAMRMMSRLQQMEGLEDQLSEARRMDNLEAIDSEKVKELLGDEEYQSVEQLKELMKMLEEAGYIQKRGNRWELTARGIRKIGQKALQDIFNKLKRDGFGRHVSPFRGVGGERTDESKVYQFGDPFLLDLEKTLMNALHRRGT